LYSKNIESLEGKRIEFTIKEVHEKPSSDQHAYYRGAVIETGLTAECFGGWTADELDAYFTDKHLGYNIHKIMQGKECVTGKVVVIRKVPSKADLNKKEMGEFMEKCIAELAIEGIVVHSSDSYKLNKFKTIYYNDTH
jgi:hypothetical protein